MFGNKKYILLIFICILFAYCNQKDKGTSNDETILKGTATIFVDETLAPIVEDEIMVFESKYDAKINLVSKSESEVLNSLFDKKATIAVLARNLLCFDRKAFIFTEVKKRPFQS